MDTREMIIDGQLITVKICKPSKRRAASSVQKSRYQRVGRAATWLAWDTGKKVLKHQRNED